jgi:multiple sugar transport system substrate-binding protein
MHARRVVSTIAATSALALTLSACGGSGSSSSGSSAAAGEDSRGPITYVQGKDNSNIVRPLIEKWNAAHPNEKVTFKEQSDNANQQHDDLVQNFQAKNANYDVVSVDIVWVAEFAAKGWLVPLEGKNAVSTDGMLPATVKGGTYNGKLYGAPTSTDGGMLWYRKDLVKTPPKTWDEMMSMCSIAKQNNIDCYAGQFANYEGLTVNASESIAAAGGKIVDDSGKAAVNTAEAQKGLQQLADAYKNGNIPKEAITYQEEQGRMAFESGKLLFLRNWPYVYNLMKTDSTSKVKDTFGMAPLPGKSSLGGHMAALNVNSKNKATATDFVKFLASEETQKSNAIKGSLAPVTAKLYEDPELLKQLPYLSVLKQSLDSAEPRPVTPFYPAVTKAIQDNSYAAIKGEKTPAQATADMETAINSASQK